MISSSIKKLCTYAVEKELISKLDFRISINRILEALKLEEYEDDGKEYEDVDLETTLSEITDYAVKEGIIDDGIASRDLFDTKLMGLLTPNPSAVIEKFTALYKQSPEKATEFYYAFSKNTDYIRTYRVKKDMKWKTESEYGTIDITINLSKPEKDPKAIAAAKNAKQSGYPKCNLCVENEGYAGTLNSPARQNHRIIPLTINDSEWYMQYSPYVYYNEHCIVFNGKHTPMKIDKSCFIKLLDFVEQFPHYFLGSNADLPIVGGSILSHDHFQGGNYEFAMAKAPIEKEIFFDGFEDIKCGIVKWPMSVIRINGKSKERLVLLADKILTGWRNYTDAEAFIFAQTDGEPHNSITPIARKRAENFELDLVLRNNITTTEHPLGVYHPHAELHHIKKENIGLIEVMGLAVLPSRLKNEMKVLSQAILAGEDLSSREETAKHAQWVSEFLPKYDKTDESNIDDIIKLEIGNVFKKVLEHAGVYKRTPEGMAAFTAFVNSINKR